jgi:hypothetical protein
MNTRRVQGLALILGAVCTLITIIPSDSPPSPTYPHNRNNTFHFRYSSNPRKPALWIYWIDWYDPPYSGCCNRLGI